MATPTVSYMRSLSFATAAPHHSPSAWVAASNSVNAVAVAAARSHHHHQQQQQYGQPQQHHHHHHHHPLHPLNYSINSHNTHIYTHHLQNFNSHHDRNYTQHLQQQFQGSSMVALHTESTTPTTSPITARNRASSFAGPSPAGSGGVGGGRRRSSSIRSRNPPPFIKFDPFADEPPKIADKTSPLAVQGQTANNTDTAPCTFPIAAAGPTMEVQRYAVRTAQTSMTKTTITNTAAPTPRRLSCVGGPISTPIESRASSPAPSISRPPSPSLRSSPSPPPPAGRQPLLTGPGSLSGPNVSKLVAGIMLNRMSAGKPLRRRVPPNGALGETKKKEYVKSCLSSVVSVEA